MQVVIPHSSLLFFESPQLGPALYKKYKKSNIVDMNKFHFMREALYQIFCMIKYQDKCDTEKIRLTLHKLE